MPLDPQIWHIPPLYRRFPDHIVEIYESEDTPLNDLCELWTWKHDLVRQNPIGPPVPDGNKIAKRLGQEVADFLAIEEASQEVVAKAERELDLLRQLPDRLHELGDAALAWFETRQEPETET